MIRLLLADDHAVVRDGIRAIIQRLDPEIEIVAEAANGNEVLALARGAAIDVYLLDIAMPVLNGIDTTARLLQDDRDARVVILSMHDDRSLVERAFCSGARGYLLKESPSEEILKAVHEVHQGRCFISPAISHYLIDGLINRTPGSQPAAGAGRDLTVREREVLQLVAEGFTNKEIARKLNISANTAHVHRNNIMKKLDLHKQADLLRYALKEGITHL